MKGRIIGDGLKRWAGVKPGCVRSLGFMRSLDFIPCPC